MTECKRAFSPSRVALRLNVSERTINRAIEAGDLKAHRVGRQWRIFEPDFRAYLESTANSTLASNADSPRDLGAA